MDNDSTQPQLSPEQIQLEQLLSEAIAAERFFETDSGRLFVDLANVEINRILRDITSEKYLKDHQGYLYAVAELSAYKKLLRKMQVAASPQRRQKIEEKLGEDES